MRRPRRRHVLLGLCYATWLLVAADHLYWRRRRLPLPQDLIPGPSSGGAFNHNR